MNQPAAAMIFVEYCPIPKQIHLVTDRFKNLALPVRDVPLSVTATIKDLSRVTYRDVRIELHEYHYRIWYSKWVGWEISVCYGWDARAGLLLHQTPRSYALRNRRGDVSRIRVWDRGFRFPSKKDAYSHLRRRYWHWRPEPTECESPLA